MNPRILACLLSALILLPLAGAQDKQDKRVALVIGNSSYKRVQSLKNSENDATDMAAALKRMGYSVISGVNLDRKSMRGLIDDFNVKIREAEVALFFYSGHGVQLEGENYLVPVNAEVAVAGDVLEECVSLSRVTARMNEAGARTNVIILDACRDNPFKAVSRGIERGLAVVGRKPPESIIVYATAENERAADGVGRNGVFTKALLKNIERQEPFADILLDVSAQVRDETADGQKPAVYQNLTRRVYLAGEKPAPAPVAALPAVAAAQAVAPPAAAPVQAPKLSIVPAAPAATVPTLSVIKATGSLAIATVEAGTLYLDGQAMGVLPAKAKAKLDSVETGNHNLELRFDDGRVLKTSVAIAEGKATSVSFSGESARPNLVAWYKFDETGGEVALDSSGKGQDGIVIKGASFVPGKIGNAVSLNGRDQYVKLPGGLTSSLDNFTISFWTLVHDAPVNSCFFSFGESASSSFFSLAADSWGVGTAYTSTRGSGGGDQIALYSKFPLEAWKHVALTLDAKTAAIYIDGRLVKDGNASLNPSRLNKDIRDYIGKSQLDPSNTAANEVFLKGLIDDFRIYDRAFSAQEIEAIYAEGGPTAGPPKDEPPKYASIDDACTPLLEFGGHRLFLSKDSVGWDAADAICKQLGGHLVVIESAAMDRAITKQLREGSIKTDCWIGLVNERGPGRPWKWVTGETVKYSDWFQDQHQPDYQGRGIRTYALISQWANFHWDDVDSSAKTRFILETD